MEGQLSVVGEFSLCDKCFWRWVNYITAKDFAGGKKVDWEIAWKEVLKGFINGRASTRQRTEQQSQ